MTDEPAPDHVPAESAPAPVVEPPPPPPPPPPPRRPASLVPWVFGLGFVVLGLAIILLWVYPVAPPPRIQPQPVEALTERVQALETQVKQLAARPAAQPQALASLQAQLTELASRKPPPPPDLSGIENRITALEHAPKPAPSALVDLGPLQQKLGTLSAQVAALGAIKDQMGQVGKEQQSLADQVKALTERATNADSGLTGRIDAQAKALDALRDKVGQIDAALARTEGAIRAQAALAALSAGRPLGAIQGAPPAVARFATEAPPTVESLRRTFPAAAHAALAASAPNNADQRFLDRVWQRAQSLVTVRQGDQVLVGDPAAGIIARAQEAIDTGDVAGAADALSKLTGPAADAVSSWLAQARALLAARSALLGMAEPH